MKKLKFGKKIPFITSDDPFFHTVITEVTRVFLNKTQPQYPVSTIYKFLIVLHEDNYADIFINDFRELHAVKLKRSKKAGAPVYSKDITDISEVRFPEIEIKPADAVVYCRKIGWKFGLHFDFTRKLDISRLSKNLGKLVKDLTFKRDISFFESELKKIQRKENIQAIIVTEGKNDWKHLKKAKSKLKSSLRISFNEYEEDRGDSYTLKMCEYISKILQSKNIIFIFDRDNPSIMKELDKKTKNGSDYQVWGNKVFSFYLPQPSHRAKYKNISMEFFYKDEEIKTLDTDGKRLFFNNELKKEISPNGTCRMVVVEPDLNVEFSKKIYDANVEKIINQRSEQIAFSKTRFADNILNGKNGFNNFNFSEFNKIFKIIEDIIKTN